MISIVICSINSDFLLQVKENISATIGVEYELLVWDNKVENKGICEVYNLMAADAKFEYLCFLHEDILFESANWGGKIVDIFSKRLDIGVIGVAGSKYKSGYFSGWYGGVKEFDCANIIHRFSWGDKLESFRPEAEKELEEVVCIDGVFICTRKSIWEEIKFDKELLSGFHFYDIDFSARASSICTVAVSFDILLIHITKGGDFGNAWVDVAIAYHENKKADFPFFLNKESVSHSMDVRIIKTWLDVLKNYPVSWRNKWRWLSKQHLFQKPQLYYSILKFLLYKPLGLRNIHKPRNRK